MEATYLAGRAGTYAPTKARILSEVAEQTQQPRPGA